MVFTNLTISNTQRQKITIKKLKDEKITLDQLKIEINEQVVKSTQKANHDHDMLVSLVNDIQEKSDSKMQLIEMINDLRKEVHMLKTAS